MSDLDEYTGDNLPLEIEERKDNIAEQYRQYLESLSREELIEKLTINQTNDSLIENIMETDQMGQEDCGFEPT
ncbi:hypothetical protein LCGC14_2096980 [marine sediment metagenome]|uniref:Uncharacterized protein n=1 Tax=marine sediment metagenome TaxID=412755 RepID=A0A0F9EB87_9ZZZZ|nr:hypothetical protein [Candidatus Scalindua sp.]